MHIIVARTDGHYAAAIALFEEYAMGLGIDLQFQNFQAELEMLPQKYGPPKGELWLVQDGEDFVGCAALWQLDENTCELKRMFVKPAYRGQRLGEKLMDIALATARGMAYHYMKLDSLRRLTAAVNLYRRYGFEEIAPYNFNPEADVVYFEKNLRMQDKES